VFEKNLKYYRLKSKMTKKELAEKCGVTPMAITNYEQGTRRPDMEIITRLAEALDVQIADFIKSGNSSLQFKHAEFRKTTAMNQSRQEYIRSAVEEHFGRFFNAVDCLGGNPLPAPMTCHYIESTRSYEEDAVLLRKKLGLPIEGPVQELTAVLENKGIFIVEIDIDEESFSGMNGMVNEYPYIAVNSGMTPERVRSTIAHELAHIMFVELPGEKEKYATAVSGAFLIGKEDLLRELGIHRSRITKDMLLICKEYGISMMLLVKRSSQAEIISENLEKEFYMKAGKAGWRRNEPSRMDKNQETPRLFQQLVFRAVNEEGISVQKGAELLQMTYDEVAEQCELVEV